MESLSMALLASPPLPNPKPPIPKPLSLPPKPNPSFLQPLSTTALIAITSAAPLPCSAAADVSSGKIDLESVLVAIDDFFNRNPFFGVACAFIWLIAIPLTEEYFRKYKLIPAIDAFRRLRDEPNAQLLDIRGPKSLKYLKSPNLKFLGGKSVVRVRFSEDDVDGFVKQVLESFDDPANTVLCILDDLDGNSLKVAELLFKSGFKEAYGIKGGVAGRKGWLEIQNQLLPPSVHILPRKKKKRSKKSNELGNENGGAVPSSVEEVQATGNGDSTSSLLDRKPGSRSSSPYPNYPDLKPPSSPTPSKPC